MSQAQGVMSNHVSVKAFLPEAGCKRFYLRCWQDQRGLSHRSDSQAFPCRRMEGWVRRGRSLNRWNNNDCNWLCCEVELLTTPVRLSTKKVHPYTFLWFSLKTSSFFGLSFSLFLSLFLAISLPLEVRTYTTCLRWPRWESQRRWGDGQCEYEKWHVTPTIFILLHQVFFFVIDSYLNHIVALSQVVVCHIFV